MSAKVTPRPCTAGYTDGRVCFFREKLVKEDREDGKKKISSWSFSLFLLLSSVCRLAALITALHKSHLSVSGLVITQKASVWEMLLVTLYSIREAQGQWSSICSCLFFWPAPCYPRLSAAEQSWIIIVRQSDNWFFWPELWWTGLYSVFIDTALRTSKRKCHEYVYESNMISLILVRLETKNRKNPPVYTLKSLLHQPISGFCGRPASLERFQIRDNDLMLENDIITYQSNRKFANPIWKMIFAVRLCHVNSALSSP